ncbi:hypothetical protein OF83DRAFT_1170589 [Amylostereum chailletii]|nr:hypothetical protein OF83DRAFT_1170589 [Amylostereum chailletii]
MVTPSLDVDSTAATPASHFRHPDLPGAFLLAYNPSRCVSDWQVALTLVKSTPPKQSRPRLAPNARPPPGSPRHKLRPRPVGGTRVEEAPSTTLGITLPQKTHITSGHASSESQYQSISGVKNICVQRTQGDHLKAQRQHHLPRKTSRLAWTGGLAGISSPPKNSLAAHVMFGPSSS